MVDLTDKTLKKKKSSLRHNEYYDMQNVFDELHAKAVKGKSFNNLLEIITDRNNILLAYRNIKNNKGSRTKGTDGKTIEHYKDWSEDKIVKYFQYKLSNYSPKSVRRVEIPKDNGKFRPLGIPCMDDRIIQQCILQVLDPICEAKFHTHSYGFRPNRSTTHAIARTLKLLNQNQLHYVVDIDIKGFFDNVNHGKLLKQLWTLGIQDKNLLSILGRILKSEVQGIGKPHKGTPQGGIISPLLSNVVLNELDWWLSDQWESMTTKHSYAVYGYDQSSKFRALQTASNLKEFYFVRYADDFKILCRDYQSAQKIFIATRLWLKERLGLEISPEKSKITNVRKGKTEFLGISLFVKKKGKTKNGHDKYVAQSKICDKAKSNITRMLKGQIIKIQKNPHTNEVCKLNSMILGVHNYYNKATLCSLDFAEIAFQVSKSLYNRLKNRAKSIRGNRKPLKTKPKSMTYLKLYGNYNHKPIVVAGVHIFPIHGCKFVTPYNFSRDINSYTPYGRKLIHDKLSGAYTHLIKYLLDRGDYGDKSVELVDNQISLMAGQNGKCGITGLPLVIGHMECHHKKPKEHGGTDEYKNLVWLNADVHELIHAKQQETIGKYLQRLQLDARAFKKLNALRKLSENSEIVITV